MADAKEKLVKIKEKVEVLKKKGGFRILEGIIDGVKGIRELNPKDEARRTAFLSDEDKKEKREQLKNELSLIKEVLTQSEDASEIIEKCKEKNKQAAKVLQENLKEVFSSTKDLEKAYRALDLFFRNSEEESIRNLYIINVPVEEFKSADNTELRESLDQHFKDKYDRFSLEDNYSLLVIPGHLGDNLDFWSKMAHKYQITLVTDYKDEKDMESVEDSIEEKKLKGSDKYLSNTIVTCNYGVVRKKLEGVEDDDMYLPMSTALAGKMYSGDGIQPSAGKKYGKLDGVLGTRIELLRSKTDAIDKMGMIPIIHEKQWGVVAMSDTTLAAESSDPDLKAIGVVRANDWIQKSIVDYLNALTFQTFDGNLRNEIKRALNDFFKKVSGYGGLLESYSIDKIDKDPDNPQKVDISIRVKPYFATKHYVVDYTGTQGKFESDEKD